MPDNEPIRLSLGEHSITIDPQTQHVTISGTIPPLRLSFEDASRLLGILFDPEAFWWQGISYCAQHLPESYGHASEGWDP